MRVLKLLGLLLLATRPTQSVATEPGHGWGEPLGSGQANVATTTIASSTISKTMSPSQERAMVHDKTQGLPDPVLEYSKLESYLLPGNSLLALGLSIINRVDESSSMNVEWHSRPGSKIDASHINIDSQQLSQEGENLDCLIDLNRIPIDSEYLPSNSLENFVPDNRNAHQFGENVSMNVEWHSRPGSNIDASHINIDSQQLSQEGDNLDCLIDLNRIPIDSEILPSNDTLENSVPDNRNAHQFCGSSSRNLADWNPSTSSNRNVSRISTDGHQSIESVEGTTFDCRIENTINSKRQPVDVRESFVLEGFPEQAHETVLFRNSKYFSGLRMLCRRLNWDLDEVKDYQSLCVFLGKGTNPKQVEFLDSVAMTENMIKLLLLGESGRDNVEIGQNNIKAPDQRPIVKSTSTLQKLIQISNFVLKLVSCRRSGYSISPNVITCLKRTCIPVLQCLVTCCRKDIDLFQARWGKHFKHRNFGMKCCPGSGSNYHACGYQMTNIARNPDNRDKDSDLLDLNALVVAVGASTTSQEKLKLCWKFIEKFGSSNPMARKIRRKYYARSPKPIWGCFVHHCGQDTDKWIRKWGTQFRHGEFSNRKCQGLKSIQCGSIDPPFDVKARFDLRNKSTRDLLPVLFEIREAHDQFMIAKTTSMRSPNPGLTSLLRKCRPVYNCFDHHCAGSVEEFVRRWGDSVLYSRFRREYCPGPGTKGYNTCPYDSRLRKVDKD